MVEYTLEEALSHLKGQIHVTAGYVHYLSLSQQWDEKAVDDLTELGIISLTHKPGKMLQKISDSLYSESHIRKMIAENPHLNMEMFQDDGKPLSQRWFRAKPIFQNVTYESDVFGDDWNDSPASGNAGPPYGGVSVRLAPGDFVIVIKQGVKFDDKRL